MVNIALLAVAAALLAGLLAGERRESTSLKLIFKTPLSVLFVVAVLVQPHPLPFYYHLILAGLVCGLIGDVCLALKRRRSFTAGLVAFLLGHILYVVAFVCLTDLRDWLTPVHFLVAAVSGGVFLWLRPRLGPMLVPVTIYIVVISVMLTAAWVAFLNLALNPTGAWALFVGALSFYASDLFVARDRFVKTEFLNRFVGLPLYYAGQFLLAFSVGLVR